MVFNIHCFRVFRAVMQERSIVQAAQVQHTSYSNVKRIMEAMQQDLSIPLFHRASHGNYEPTSDGELLGREIMRFLSCVDAFEAGIQSCEKMGKPLRLGVEPGLVDSQYFHNFFQALCADPGYRTCMVEIKNGSEKQALLAGECDIILSLNPVKGRRLEVYEMPACDWYVGCHENQMCLKGEAWGLHFPGGQGFAEKIIRDIEKTHGGMGRLLEAFQFNEWLEEGCVDGIKLVVSLLPTKLDHGRVVRWQLLPMELGFSMHALFLHLHPYGSLKQVIHRAVYEMVKQHIKQVSLT